MTFLRHAVAAQRKRDNKARTLWLEAASHLHGADAGSVVGAIKALLAQQRFDAAITLAETSCELEPDHAELLFHLGLALQLAGRHAEAMPVYRRAMAIAPDLPSLRNNLAAALLQGERSSAEAVALLERALELTPDDANGWTNLSYAQLARQRLTAALAAGERAVALAPDDPRALTNHANVLREAQRWDEAERHASAAHRLAPADASYCSNLGMLHLLRGNYADGWREHEARWSGSAELRGHRPALPGPLWRGEPLAGKTLLLWGEQGMGDLLQFCRYVPLLADRVHREGGRLSWNSFPQMGALLSRSLAGTVDEYTAGGDVHHLPAFDYELPLLTLPLVFDTREATIPGPSPYLVADPAAVKYWRARLANERRLKVGLAWTGSLGHQRNPFRAVGWERYARHFGGPELGDAVAFYSLQPGADADVAAARRAGLDLVDHTASLRCFDDTAAFIEALDLVITVCTSVAHLSGALGQRTWVLLDVNPHWVWLLGRRDSPWYPSATLYRQPSFAQWEPVMHAVSRDLAAHARERASSRGQPR